MRRFSVLFPCPDLPAFLTRARFSIAVLAVLLTLALSTKKTRKREQSLSVELTEVRLQTTFVAALRDG